MEKEACNHETKDCKSRIHWMRQQRWPRHTTTTTTATKTECVGNNMLAGGNDTCAYFAACNHSRVACSDVASMSSLNLDGPTENKFGIYRILFNFLKVKIPTLLKGCFFWLQSLYKWKEMQNPIDPCARAHVCYLSVCVLSLYLEVGCSLE